MLFIKSKHNKRGLQNSVNSKDTGTAKQIRRSRQLTRTMCNTDTMKGTELSYTSPALKTTAVDLQPDMFNQKDALFLACELNQKDICENILHDGFDLDLRDIEGYTALHIAVVSSSWDCVDLLLRHGANVKTKNYDGLTLLHTLAFNNPLNKTDERIKYMIRFIQLGADLNAKASFPDIYNGRQLTALDIALVASNENAIIVLLEASVSLDCTPIPYTKYIEQKEPSNAFDNFMLQRKVQDTVPYAVPTLLSITRNNIRGATSESEVLTKEQLGLPRQLVDYVNLSSLESDLLMLTKK